MGILFLLTLIEPSSSYQGEAQYELTKKPAGRSKYQEHAENTSL